MPQHIGNLTFPTCVSVPGIPLDQPSYERALHSFTKLFTVQKSLDASKLSKHPQGIGSKPLIRNIKNKNSTWDLVRFPNDGRIHFQYAHFIPIVGVGKRGAY